MPQVVGPVERGPASPIVLTITGATPQVFAYRVWMRRGTAAWSVLGEGSTATPGPHAYSAPYADGLQFYYWISVGGAPSAPFECSLTFSQSGIVVGRGAIRISGQADASGVAAVQDWVNVS